MRSEEAAAEQCIDRMSGKQTLHGRNICLDCHTEPAKDVTGQNILQPCAVNFAATAGGNTGSSALLSAPALSSLVWVKLSAARCEC